MLGVLDIAVSSNGKTHDFDSCVAGSSPVAAAMTTARYAVVSS